MSKVLYCGCKREPSHATKYQDKAHGIGYRVHNEAKSAIPNKVAWRCTVCGKVRE